MMLSRSLEVAGEGEGGDAVALGADRLVELLEEQDQGVDPVVVGDVDDRAAAADEQDRVVLGQLLLDLVEPGVVRLLSRRSVGEL